MYMCIFIIYIYTHACIFNIRIHTYYIWGKLKKNNEANYNHHIGNLIHICAYACTYKDIGLEQKKNK